jgi:NADH dehydrogenase
MGIDLKTNAFLEEIDGGCLKFNDGSTLETNTLIWAAGVKGNVLKGIANEQIEKSRITTDAFNKVNGYDNIFAIGDVAGVNTEEVNPHPMLAPVAIQQGQHLGKNFKLMLKGKSMKPFEYFNKGVMATIGRNKAVVDLPFGIKFSGFPAWLSWMFIHLVFLIGFRRKFVVLTNWIHSYFTFNKSTKAIINSK